MKKEISVEFVSGKHSIGYVSNGFQSRFYGQSFEPVKVAPRPAVLPRAMNDAEIEGQLKPGYCTMGDVFAVITSDNKEYKDGNWNLFYFEACVVNVGWDAGAGEWFVDTWDRGGSRWDEGYRVFSPASDRKRSVARNSDSDTLTLESLRARIEKLESIFSPELLKLLK